MWEHFARLCGKRESDGMGGVSPIRYADMLGYCGARHLPQFAAWEVDMLDRLDLVWRTAHNAAAKRAAESAKSAKGMS